MKNETKLTLVKTAHTAVWVVMAAASVLILYSGIMKSFSVWLWLSVGLLCLESIVLVMNKWTCPLTPIAMRYTLDRSENFDIYLPRIVAKYNKIIFGTIFTVGLLLVIANVVARP